MNKKSKKTSSWWWLIVPICFAPISSAHAYLDPGTGSYAVQIAIGIIFGATYTVKTFGGRIIQFFKKDHGKDEKSEK